MNQNRVEFPVNRSPILFCQGECRRPTRHSFTERNAVRSDTGVLICEELLFSCVDCKTKRVYGRE